MDPFRLYYQHPYIKTFQATVASCIPGKEGTYQVTLDQTAFYPEGGGQPSDQGTLGGVQVLAVREKQGQIFHQTAAPLEPGTAVQGVIDWDRRLANMQGHTGEHILSGLIHSQYGYDNVGFHMGEEEITVDFNGILTPEQLDALEEQANEQIYANVPVLESYPTQEELKSLDYRSKKELEGQVRIVEVPGSDCCACCGTHVEKTGEVGMIKITGMIHYKGGVRISMVCGKKALEDYRRRVRIDSRISNLLSARLPELDQAVEKLRQDHQDKLQQISRLKRQIFELKAAGLPESNSPLALCQEGQPADLRQLCTLLYEGGKGSVVLVYSPSGRPGEYFYALGSSLQDMRTLSKTMNQRLSGRGGGSALMTQGSWNSSAEEIEQVFLEEVNGFKS